MFSKRSSVRHEIGHVLFIDIAGRSKLLLAKHTELLGKLNAIAAGTEQFRRAQAEAKVMRLPNDDGIALVFRDNLESPAHCAVELSKDLKAHPELFVRMGIHSGPINEVSYVNGRINLAGAGINLAQRIMDCGDAGHILLSKHAADHLERFPLWREHLHELGPVEVKHGVKLDIVNFYNEEAGNSALPRKLRDAAEDSRLLVSRRRQKILVTAMVSLAIVSALAIWAVSPWSPLRTTASPIADKSIALLPLESSHEERENAVQAYQEAVTFDPGFGLETAIALHPAAVDAFQGPQLEENMARVYASLGDADHAIPILRRHLGINHAGAITPASLRLDPIWDRIRNDPRFQELNAAEK